MLKLNLDPDRRFLRQFAWASLLMFPLIGVLLTWKFGAPLWLAIGLAGIGVLVFAVEVVLVPLLDDATAALLERLVPRTVFLVLTLVTFPIGFVVSHVLMALIYYLVVTPIGLVFRLIGRDALRLRQDPTASSHWVERTQQRRPSSYFKLY